MGGRGRFFLFIRWIGIHHAHLERQAKEYVRYGTATFVLNGISMQLTVFQSLKLREIPEYADYVFIPFNDDTNGTETYGGGRYLDLRFADVEDHKLTIDFNRSYNPYCAYSDGYSCPVPPNENRLPVKVQAGENVVWRNGA